jgi:hypothetical protein
MARLIGMAVQLALDTRAVLVSSFEMPCAADAHAMSLAVIGSHVGTGLDSADHGRKVLFEIDEVVLAEQDCRSGALSGLDHQDLVEVDQDFP